MAEPVKGEWELTEEQMLQGAIARLSIAEHEIRAIEKRWRRLRRLAQNPARMMGQKY